MPDRVEELVEQGADLLFVWGGDGMVQRAIDGVVGKPVTLAILPAGTANLFATNLGMPDGPRGRRPDRARTASAAALDVGEGERRALRASWPVPGSTR